MITQAKVKKVKQYLKRNWRDQNWWDFMHEPEVLSIRWALIVVPQPQSLAEIVAKAKKDLELEKLRGEKI